MKTTAQLINSLPWPDAKYQYAVVNTRPDGSFLIVYSDEKPSFHSLFHFWVSNTSVKTTAMNGEETTDWKSAIVTHEQWLAANTPADKQAKPLPTAKDIILSVPAWPEGKNYAVLSRVCTGTYAVLFCIEKPVYITTTIPGVKPERWGFQDHPYQYGPVRKGDGWNETIVTYREWLSAQPPAQPMPQVGETWMSSGGQVKIVRVHNRAVGSALRWHCCAEYADGMLDIFNLEELKPMPTPRELFVNSVMEKIEEHIEPAATILDIAILISVGKLDAELAALGYVPAKAAV